MTTLRPIPAIGRQVKVSGWTYPPKPPQPRTNTVGETLERLRAKAERK